MKDLDLSIVIPTYNRHNYLIRTLKYWNDKEVIVHVLDGSDKPLPKNIIKTFSQNINYHYLKLSLIERIGYSQKLINTKYVALLSDDEFYLTKSLKEFINILEKDKSLSCCSGLTMSYNYDKKNLEINSFYQYINPPFENTKNINLMEEDPIKRVEKHMSNYIPIATYNVTRVEFYKKIVNLIGSKEYKALGSWEIQFEVAMCLLGKIKFIPWVYWIRSFEAPRIRNTSPSMTTSNNFSNWWILKKNLNETSHFISSLITLKYSKNKNFNNKIRELSEIIDNYCNKKIYTYKKLNLNFLSTLKKIKILIPAFILKKLVDRSFNKKIKILKNYNIKVDETEIDEIVSLIKTNPIML
tara:strand:- start:1956 stop:3020 length:1065 start_codon:yes stop_codon:yes gene_type:complete